MNYITKNQFYDENIKVFETKKYWQENIQKT